MAQKQLIDLPLAIGLDTKSDKKVAKGLLSLKNGEVRSTGLVKKRRALVPLSAKTRNGGIGSSPSAGYRPNSTIINKAYGLFSARDSLVMAGADIPRSIPNLAKNLTTGDLLSSYMPLEDRWVPIVPYTPCSVAVERTGETNSVVDPQIAIGEGYRVVAFPFTNSSGNPDVTIYIVDDVTGALRWKFVCGDNSDRPIGKFVKSKLTGRYKYVCIIDDKKIVTWDPASPQTAPVIASTGSALTHVFGVDCCLDQAETTLWVLSRGIVALGVIIPQIQSFDAEGVLGTDAAVFGSPSALATSLQIAACIFSIVLPSGAERIIIAFQGAGGDLILEFYDTAGTHKTTVVDGATFDLAQWSHITASSIDVTIAGVATIGAFALCVASSASDQAQNRSTQVNIYDSTGAPQSGGAVIARADIIAHAFKHNGRVYLPLVYGAATETCLFLYSLHSVQSISGGTSEYLHTPNIVAKAMHNRVNGARIDASVCQIARRGDSSYILAATRLERVVAIPQPFLVHSPDEEVTSLACCEFTLEDAPQTTVDFGKSFIMPGGTVGVLDGSLEEINFHIAPIAPGLAQSSTGVAAGTYAYVVVAEWTDRNGQIHRSAPSLPTSIVLASSKTVTVTIRTVQHVSITKYNSNALTLRVYRTESNGTNYYFVGEITSPLVDNNNYTATIADTTSDTALIAASPLYTNTGELEPTAAPPSNVIVASHERIFLIPGDDRETVWYTKPKQEAYAPEFVDGQYTRIPNDGDGTALANQDGTIVVFKKSAIYVFAGDGPNALGQGSFSTPRRLPFEIGCSDSKSIVTYRDGTFFKSESGFYLLDRSLQVEPIGLPVTQFNSYDVAGACAVPALDQIWIGLANSSLILVYDYIHRLWGTHDVGATVAGLTYLNGEVHVLCGSGIVLKYDATKPAEAALFMSTPWYTTQSMQGLQKVWWLHFMGELDGAFKVRIFYDYKDGEDDYSQTVKLAAKDGRKLVRIKPAKRKCTTFRLDIEQIGDLRKDMGLNALSLAVAPLGVLARLASAETK